MIQFILAYLGGMLTILSPCIRVTVDGAAAADSHGTAIDAQGQGIVQRLYQLVRQNCAIADRTFKIEFLDPGVQAFAFTFG